MGYPFYMYLKSIRIFMYKPNNMNEKDLINKINEYVVPSANTHRMRAYALKHLFEHLMKEYISVLQFKTAMQKAGFIPTASGQYHIQVLSLPEVPQVYWGRGYEIKRTRRK